MLTPDPKRRSGVEWPDFGPGFSSIELPDAEVIVAQLKPLMLDRLDTLGSEKMLLTPSPELERRLEELQKTVEQLQLETGDLLN